MIHHYFIFHYKDKRERVAASKNCDPTLSHRYIPPELSKIYPQICISLKEINCVVQENFHSPFVYSFLL